MKLQVFLSFELETNFAKLEFVQNEELETTDYNAPLTRDLAELKPEPEIITPNNPPWNGFVAFGVWFLSVLAIFIFPIFFIVPYIVINKLSLETIPEDSTAIFLNLVAIVPAHIFTLAVAWFVATKNNKFSLKDTLGFSSGGFRWWYYPLLMLGIIAVALIVTYLLPDGDNDMQKILRSSRMAVFAVVILATLTAPLVEEVVYRGILYSAFQRSVGVKWAVVIVTLLFAGVHFLQYWGSPGTLLMICVLSLVLTLIRVKTDNLLPCIIMHTIINGIQSLGLLIEPYLPKADSPLQEQAAAIIRFFT